ncbi:MAG: hypothetical protein GQ582_01045, partial [Methyloprofundus sp.]|nr:hypothetical protein [Methyloprofundus sp.]
MEQFVQVDTHYTRSINLERDIDSTNILNAYIPTSKTIQVLDKIALSFGQKDMPRAWSLVGPYGSGKSSFAIFLNHLLEDQRLLTSMSAEKLLRKYSPAIANKITAHTHGSNAYCTVLLTGSSESLSKRLLQSMHQAAQNYWAGKEAKPKVLEQLFHASQAGATSTEIIQILDQLQQAIHKVQGKGILIIIDELGKFLEYEARHQSVNDIFLLQSLAEFAYKGKQANVLLLVLMHQAFDQYAKGMNEKERNEWTKVQGRFENIPFLDSAEQTLRVVAAAFKHTMTKEQYNSVQQQTRKVTQVLAQQQALPRGMDIDIANDTLVRCYPLHPIAALILPVLCQKIAQNERTLFSYLGSQEHYGFRDSLKRLQIGDCVLVWEVFEYFILNQSIMTSDYATHRRWIEVLNAIERLGDAPASEIQLLKTIGLFNIIGAQGGLKSSEAILALCFPEQAQFHIDLQQLKTKSIINYRKFSREYRIWEGSDFDLPSKLRQSTDELGYFDLAQQLNQRKVLLPIVARRYSIKNATLRYFQPFYATSTSAQLLQKTTQAQIAFFLADTSDDISRFENYVFSEQANQLTVYVLCQNTAQIRAAVAEVVALEKIQSESPEIKSDPVAQRELKDCLMTAQYTEDCLLSQIIDQPAQNRWVWQGETLAIESKKTLQQQLSNILEKIYAKAPIIKNELINRHKTSAQANSAKNKLVTALLNNSALPDLGFDAKKYPPEKSIYRALFKETGIHREQSGHWQLMPPDKNNPYKLFPIWAGIDDFLSKKSGAQPLN